MTIWRITSHPTPWRLRQVSRRQLWMILAGSTLLWFAAIGVAGLWMYHHAVGVAAFRQQALHLRLPSQMHASADINSSLYTRMDTKLALNVPIDQTLLVELPGLIKGESQLDVVVPVKADISHAFVVDVKTHIDTRVSIAAWLPDIRVQFPLAMAVPVSLQIPVDAQVPLSLSLQVQAHMPASVEVPVKTAINIALPIHQVLETDATSRAHFALHALDKGLPVELVHAQLHMPLSHLQLRPRQ